MSFMVSTSGSGGDDAMEEYKGALCLVQGLRQVVVGSAWLLQFLDDDGWFVDRDAWEGSPFFVP